MTEENGLSVRHFNDFVPTDQFEKYMQSSDYILGPINVNFSSEGYNEIYGVTKMTGTVSDMIEYARPAIVPSNLKMPEELESSTVFYQSPDDLREQIVRLLDSEVYQKLSACALENSRKYTPENFYI